jgi:tubulin polyglutamylase complex subunit 2
MSASVAQATVPTTNSTNTTNIIHEKSDLSQNVINFLREHDGITGVDFVQSSAVSITDITAFEQRESIRLPEDYKSFLLTSDGFKLRWSVSFRTKIHPLGQLQLHRLRDVSAVMHRQSDEWSPSCVDDVCGSGSSGSSGSSSSSSSKVEANNAIGIETKLVRGRRIRMLRQIPNSIKVYEIDSTSSNTRVAFLYGVQQLGATTNMGQRQYVGSKRNGSSSLNSGSGSISSSGSGSGSGHGTSDPQVWYQDNSERWFFIANSFMDYFRLMVTHLGLPDWQSAYTDVGLDPTSRQWFNFLVPNNRSSVDTGGGVRSSPLNGGGSKKSSKEGTMSFGAFTGGVSGEINRTKGLVTLRDVTGRVDDMTSPVLSRNNMISGGGVGRMALNGRSSANSSGGTNGGVGSMQNNNTSRRNGGGNASNWFDLNTTQGGSDRRSKQMRPGSAPMRRRGDRRRR